MYSPQFLAQLRAYLASGGKEDFGGGISGLAPTPMPVAAPEEDDLSKGITAGLNSFKQHSVPQDTKLKTYIPGGATREQMPIPVVMRQPPVGYRPGIDPEWNYGIANPQSASDINSYNIERTQNMAGGGVVSTGNKVADARIAAGDQRVINNQKAAAMYSAQENARTGAAIPEHLKRWLPAGGGREVNLNKLVAVANPTAPAAAGKYRNFWDRINGGGPGAGYTSPLDWINGGGQGGSYANPGTNIRGLGAAVRDVQLGGIGALARDAVNGRGFGASGEDFRGGRRAMLFNALGVNPAGAERSIFNIVPEGNEAAVEFWKTNRPEEAKGTKGTEGTPEGKAMGGIVDSGVPVNFAKGGIADIPDPAAQAPAGNEKDLISQAISAIKGEVEDPRPVLGAFLAKYGEDALRNLVDKVQSGEVDDTAARSSGMLKGPGDGMNDRIPAKVEGGQDVLLANNEYVVPADVISALGNGSSDAGAQHMDKMLERVRTAAHGKPTQQKKVTAEKVLPA